MPELGPGPPEPARNSQVAPNGLCLAVPPVKPDFAVVGRGRCLMCCPCFKIAFCDLKLATASASARGRSFDPALQQSRSVRPRIRGQGRHRRRKNPELRVSELDARVSGGLVWIAEVAEVKRGRRVLAGFRPAGLNRKAGKIGGEVNPPSRSPRSSCSKCSWIHSARSASFVFQIRCLIPSFLASGSKIGIEFASA